MVGEIEAAVAVELAVQVGQVGLTVAEQLELVAAQVVRVEVVVPAVADVAVRVAQELARPVVVARKPSLLVAVSLAGLFGPEFHSPEQCAVCRIRPSKVSAGKRRKSNPCHRRSPPTLFRPSLPYVV